MGTTNSYRTEAIVRRIASTVPAATTTYTVDLPAGIYRIALSFKSSVTGTTTLVTARPFVDAERSQINGVDYRMYEPDDSAVVAALIAPAGAAGRYANLVSDAAEGDSHIFVVPHGIQLTITKGGAVTAETFELDICATRVG